MWLYSKAFILIPARQGQAQGRVTPRAVLTPRLHFRGPGKASPRPGTGENRAGATWLWPLGIARLSAAAFHPAEPT